MEESDKVRELKKRRTEAIGKLIACVIAGLFLVGLLVFRAC